MEDFQNLDTVLHYRQSTREFSDEKVGSDQISALIQAAEASPIGCRNYKGYGILVIQDRQALQQIAKAFAEKTGRPDPLYGAGLLFLIYVKEGAIADLERFDAGIIAENIHLKATSLKIGSLIIYSFIRALLGDAAIWNQLGLPEHAKPLLSVAAGYRKKEWIKREIKPLIDVQIK